MEVRMTDGLGHWATVFTQGNRVTTIRDGDPIYREMHKTAESAAEAVKLEIRLLEDAGYHKVH